MAQTVVDAALWASAEAARTTSRNTPMDSMDFSPPAHAFTHSPELAQVHCNKHAVLLHRDESNQGNLEEALLACNLSPGCPECPVCPEVSGGVRTCPRTYVRSVRGHMSECPKYVRGHMSGVSGVRRVRVSEVSEGVRGCPAICPYVRCEVSKPGIHL